MSPWKEVERTWVAFCEAVVAAQEAEGRRLTCYFGESQTVCDAGLLAEWHDNPVGGPDQDEVILLSLPEVKGFHQDGGGW